MFKIDLRNGSKLYKEIFFYLYKKKIIKQKDTYWTIFIYHQIINKLLLGVSLEKGGGGTTDSILFTHGLCLW